MCGFAAEIDGKRIVGKLKEKSAARETYDEAIAVGDGAYLLEQVGEPAWLEPPLAIDTAGCTCFLSTPHCPSSCHLGYFVHVRILRP